MSTLGKRRPIADRAISGAMMRHANLVVTAWDAGLLSGIARSLTDLSYICYLAAPAAADYYPRRGFTKHGSAWLLKAGKLLRQVNGTVADDGFHSADAMLTKNVDKPWAHCFIFGLVSPSVMETAAQCPGGVAKVETEQSVPNWLVGVITFGIYTPMHIKVTCAGQAVSFGGEVEYLLPEVDMVIAEDATPEEATEIMQSAVDLALESKEPVFVKFGAVQ